MTASLSPDLTMAEVLQQLPGAQRALFRLYHIGGCASCGFRPDETLAEVCARNENLNPGAVLDAVREAVTEEQKMLIEPRALADALESGTVRILDIRTREEYDAVHLPQAILLNQELLQQAMASWPKDDLLVLVDHQGMRGLDAAAYFAGHGFTNVKALRGGIDAWSLEIDPNIPRYTIE